ncbi:MAG: hypothetical protein AMXMBFR53_38820 [Gemmatimonadota bacterium]
MAAVRDSGSARRRGGSRRDGRVKTLAAQFNAELKAVFPHNAVEYFISYDAAAEAAGLTVLHYDADFDRIGEVTRQPTEWVVPRGTVD